MLRLGLCPLLFQTRKLGIWSNPQNGFESQKPIPIPLGVNMKMLSYQESPEGWSIKIDTGKKPYPARGKDSIVQTEFFPRIALKKDELLPFKGQLKVYGSMIVHGTMKYFPVTKVEKKQNSTFWGRFVGEERSIVAVRIEGFVPRQKDLMDIALDKDYVFDGTQWVPAMVFYYTATKDAGLMEFMFHQILRNATSYEDIEKLFELNFQPIVKARKELPREVVRLDSDERASTFHYGLEAHRPFSPFNDAESGKTYKRSLREVLGDESTMNPVQKALLKRIKVPA